MNICLHWRNKFRSHHSANFGVGSLDVGALRGESLLGVVSLGRVELVLVGGSQFVPGHHLVTLVPADIGATSAQSADVVCSTSHTDTTAHKQWYQRRMSLQAGSCEPFHCLC